MRRDTQAVLLLLVGATLLKIGVTGSYVRYVKPGQLPLLLVGGVVLVAVAGVALWHHIRSAMPSAGAAAQPDAEVGARAPVSPAGHAAAGGPATAACRAAAAGLAAAAHEGFDTSATKTLDITTGGGRPDDIAEADIAQADIAEADIAEADVADGFERGGRALRDAAAPRVAEPAPDAEPEAGEGDDRSRIGWLLLLPALAVLVFSPPALGSFQAARTGTAVSVRSTSDFAPLPPGDPVRVTLLDYASRAVFDHGRSLSGRTVLLTGFVIAGSHGEPYLVRLFVGCCAADARPVKIGLTGDLPGVLTPDQWVEVTGTYTERVDRDSVNGDLIPYVSAVSVRDVTPPADPYET